MKIKFLKSSEKKRLLRELEERYGIKKIPYLLIETGKMKIRGFSGTMTKEEISELSEIANVEIVGIYLFRLEGRENERLRLSLDGSMIFRDQITKNAISINEDELGAWIRGKDIAKDIDKGVFVLKFGNDFLGCGISDGKKIINHVPKERRIRNS